jgi:hypothetical protein
MVNINIAPAPATLVPLPCDLYTFKAYKRTTGREGHGFIANLYRGKTKLGEVADYGDGGGAWMRGRLAPEEQTILDAAVAATPSIHSYGMDLTMSQEFLFSLLADEHDLAAELRRRSRTKTPFILADEKPGQGYRSVNEPLTANLATWLCEQFPGQTVRVWNKDAWVDASTVTD